MVRFNFVITKDLSEKMHLLTYAWFMAKHYNTQNDSASLPVSAASPNIYKLWFFSSAS